MQTIVPKEGEETHLYSKPQHSSELRQNLFASNN